MAKTGKKNWYLVRRSTPGPYETFVIADRMEDVRRSFTSSSKTTVILQVTWRMLKLRFDVFVPDFVGEDDYVGGHILLRSKVGSFFLESI